MTLEDIASLKWLTEWFGANAWIAQVFVVVLGVLLLNLLVRVLVHRLYLKLQANETPWDDAVVGALQRPLNVLIWIVGIAFAADIVRMETAAPIFNAIGPIRDVGVIATIAWFLLRLTHNMQRNIIRQNREREEPIDSTTVDAIGCCRPSASASPVCSRSAVSAVSRSVLPPRTCWPISSAD